MHIERFSNWRCFAHFKSDGIFVQRIMAYEYLANIVLQNAIHYKKSNTNGNS